MAENEKEQKKIIVDDDWKKQAQQEKEKLAKDQAVEQEKKHVRQLPPVDFASLISQLSTQAFFALGLIKLQGQEDYEPDIDLAKFHIDTLSMLEEKTKGNLSDDEQKMLKEVLQQLRMTFVKISQE